MSLSTALNNNPIVATVLTVVLLVLALGILLLTQRDPGPGPSDVYFWDLDTNEPFVGKSNEMPPVVAPSGGQGVRAHLFTCDACEPEQWFGYLERYSESALAHYEEHEFFPGGSDDLLMRELEGDRWVPSHGRRADSILEELAARCENSLTVCRP